MNALLLIAHGSRRAASNEEILALTARIAAEPENDFDRTACAFLEIASPKPQEIIQQLIEDGINEIHLFPHFLAAGTHVMNDLPALIREAEQRHPELSLHLLPHLGGLGGLSQLIGKSFSTPHKH